jgi:hypothetical protein
VIWLYDANNVNEFKTRAQREIDNLLGEIDDLMVGGVWNREIDWVQVAAPYGTDILLLSQKLGEKPVFLSVHCLVIGACKGISTAEWEENNAFPSPGDVLTYTRIYDDKFRTEQDFERGLDAGNIRDVIWINEKVGYDAFLAYGQNLEELSTGLKPGAFQIQVAAEYGRQETGSEILLFSQTSGEKGIFLSFPSIPSVFDHSKVVTSPKAKPVSFLQPTSAPQPIITRQPTSAPLQVVNPPNWLRASAIPQQQLSYSELWALSKQYGYVGENILPPDQARQLHDFMRSWEWKLTSVWTVPFAT